MGRKEEVYEPALKEKRVPLLTLDHNWHKLFSHADTTQTILNLEGKLNDLLKLQGKLNTESKEIKKLKKRLMNEIVPMVDALSQNNDSFMEQKIEENKRLIKDCNEKLDQYKDELLDIPSKIADVNNQLMLVTMDACYETLHENSSEIEEIGKWITQIRIELKKKIIRKQEKEQKNRDLYTYMHAIFGADVIQIFDLKYIPEELHKKDSGAENAEKNE
ncbi:MAG TPA: hypothetical protein VJY54_03470 [Lachnospiraceae bacterium]|nr:hypothetical protein [Lachnospiraceae bacterium]